MKNILQEFPENLYGRLAFSLLLAKDAIKNKHILDIGCGYGWFEKNTLRLKPNLIIGTEITENDLSTAKKNVTNKQVKFMVASAVKLPFPDASFDTVVSWEVLEHIPPGTEPVMFSEVSRVLKAGGRFFLSTPNKHILSQLFDPAWWLIAHRHYSLNQLEEFGRDKSLKLLSAQPKGAWLEVVHTLSFYLSKWVLRRRLTLSEKFIQSLNREYTQKGFYGIFAIYEKI